MPCNPSATINWIQATERLTGKGHATLADTLNRPLRDFITALGFDPDASFDACSIGGGAGGFSPVNGIYGTVQTLGDATHPAFVQLLNPSGSNKKLKIYELAVSIPTTGTAGTLRARSVTSPVNLTGGTNNNGNVFRLDESSVAAISTTLIGNSNLGTIITQAQAEWEGGMAQEALAGWQPTYIRVPGTFPWTILAGSALEFSTDANGAARALRVYAVWDEV